MAQAETDPVRLLERLVAFPSIAGQPTAPIAEFVMAVAQSVGARVTILPGPEGDRVNLFASIGPVDQPGYILSGHMDVVPATEPGWSSDPFRLRAEAGRLYGRGTSDMKGFLACALASLARLAGQKLARPLHLAFSYDEEAGCRGVPYLLARLPELCAPPIACIVGEPSGLRGILAHKGKAAARVEVRGCAGHSSRPDLGHNAIHALAPVLAQVAAASAALEAGPQDARFAPPYSTMQVGTVRGGEALNVIPALCVLEVEARAIAEVSPRALLAGVAAGVAQLKARGEAASFTIISEYPALALPAAAPLARLIARLTGAEPLAAVSFGTEAGLYQQAGVETIICGPGDIARAHRADEYIEAAELAACMDLLAGIGTEISA
jgi:acetylornithine deacetylase